MEQESLDLLAKVHPKLKDIIVLMDKEIPLKVIRGLASFESQEAIFAQGRTAPGEIVSNAPPGYSWHEFGLAVDVCPLSLLDHPHWEPDSPLWIHLASLGENLGAHPGAMWHHPDKPHYQLNGRFPITPSAEVRDLFSKGGIEAVWAAAEL